jgi:hypothetical protein
LPPYNNEALAVDSDKPNIQHGLNTDKGKLYSV